MLRLHELADYAVSASPAPPPPPPAPRLDGAQDSDLVGDCTDISGMQGLFDIVASRDVRTATIRQRPPVSPADAIFDGGLRTGQIVEIKHVEGDNIRWFGVIYRRAVQGKGGVNVRWFKEINNEGPSFSLELDESRRSCDLIEFRNIIGIVEF